MNDQEPKAISFGISEFPQPPVNLSAYMGYVFEFLGDRPAQNAPGKSPSRLNSVPTYPW